VWDYFVGILWEWLNGFISKLLRGITIN
jgi:hypothetical protein